MDVSFGTRLRLHRERQQVALAAVAEQTKIKVSLLDGLERDDLSHWPGGIFRRSYVRAYADAIGLEPDAVVEEFLARHPDPGEDAPAALAPRVASAYSGGRPPTRLAYLISSAIDALPALRFQAAPKRNGGGASAGRPAGEASDTGPPRADDADALADVQMRGDATSAEIGSEDSAAGFMLMHGESAGADPIGVADVIDGGVAGTAVLALTFDTVTSVGDDAPFDRDLLSSPEVATEPDLQRFANLCARLACALHVRDLSPVLEDAGRLLGAVGVILWTWDPGEGALCPAIAHGYPDERIAQLPRVRPEDDNAIAWAFRAAETRVVDGGAFMTGAVAVPVLTPAGCAGVLALELRDGRERRGRVRALATILSAQLSTLIDQPAFAEAVNA